LYLAEPSRRLYEAAPILPWAMPLKTDRGLSGLGDRCKEELRIWLLRRQVREETVSVRAFDRVLTNSFFSRENILRSYGVPARVCYLGVDLDVFRRLELPRDNMVLGIGQIARHKRLETVVRAVADLGEESPRIVWVGNAVDDGYRDEVVGLARELEVRLELLVRAPQDQVVELLNRARVLVYAPRLEPFGYPPLEAGACGLPVVAVAEGGMRESVVDGKTGLLAADDRELSGLLERILHDEKLAARLGSGGQAWVESRWTLEAAVQRLETELTLACRDALVGRGAVGRASK